MGVVRYKAGVRMPAVAHIVACLEAIAALGDDLTITSGTDSHPPQDPHARGLAADVRTHGLTDDAKKNLSRDLILRLADDTTDLPIEVQLVGVWYALVTSRWLVQIEHHGEPGEHLHVQLRKMAEFP